MALARARTDPSLDAVSANGGGPATAFPRRVEVATRRVPDPVDVIGRFDPRRVTDEQLDMMSVDPDIALGMSFVKSMIVNAGWRIESDDRRQQEFLTRAYGRVHAQLVRRALTALDFGRSPVVIDYERVDASGWRYHDEGTGKERFAWPHRGIRALVPKRARGLPPAGAAPVFADDGDEYLGFEHAHFSRAHGHEHPRGGSALFVPRELGLWFVAGKEKSYESMYGVPRTLAAFRAWWSYWFGFLMADRHFEQDADPPLVVTYPPGKSQDPDGEEGEMVDNQELAERVGRFLKEGGTISMPSEVYVNEEGRPTTVKKWGAEFLGGGENMPAFEGRLERLRQLKMESVLLPPNIFERESIDAAAAGDMFLESQVLTIAEIDEDINQHLIPKIAEANFQDPAPARKVTTGIRDRDKRLYEEVLKIVVAQMRGELGVDYRAMAQHIGLPLTAPSEEDGRGGPPAPGESDRGGKAAGGRGEDPEDRADGEGAAPTGRKRKVEGPGSRGPDTGRSAE